MFVKGAGAVGAGEVGMLVAHICAMESWMSDCFCECCIGGHQVFDGGVHLNCCVC